MESRSRFVAACTVLVTLAAGLGIGAATAEPVEEPPAEVYYQLTGSTDIELRQASACSTACLYRPKGGPVEFGKDPRGNELVDATVDPTTARYFPMTVGDDARTFTADPPVREGRNYAVAVTVRHVSGVVRTGYLALTEDGQARVVPHFGDATPLEMRSDTDLGRLEIKPVKKKRVLVRKTFRRDGPCFFHGEKTRLKPDSGGTRVYYQVMKRRKWVNYGRQTTLRGGIFDFGTFNERRLRQLRHKWYDVSLPDSYPIRLFVPGDKRYRPLSSSICTLTWGG